MKLLLKAAFRVKRHLSLVFATLITLVLLTVANQCEMITLGVISNTGADFFSLFRTETTDTPFDQREVSLSEVQKIWPEISGSAERPITKQDTVRFLAKNDSNFLSRILQKFRKELNLSGSNLETILTMLILVAIFKAIFLFASRYTTQLLAIRVSTDLRQQYFEHIQKLPMSFYHKYNIGSLSSRVAGDASQISLSINSLITNYVHTPFTLVTSLVVCFYISWQLSLVIFFGLPSIVFPVIFLTRKVKRITRQFLKNQERFTSVLIDYLAGIQTVKIFSMEKFSLKKYKEQNDQMAYLQQKTAKYDLLVRPILHTITTFCLAAVVIFGLYFLNISVPELIVFCGFLHMFYEPVKKFAEENTNIQKGVVAAERLFEVMRLEPHFTDKDGASVLTEFTSKIEFDHVWFKYEDEWVLKDVSFTIEKGQTVGIVGATGAGKSTILQLLPRLYEVQRGSILVDGIALGEITQQSLREQISFVSQKPFLFYDTVASNIAYGKPYSREEIINAAKRGHAHEFIVDLPDQYDTHLAEMGQTLSGGQQQRLAISRALVKKAPILILDEATSALDSISEDHIRRAIQELHGEITQIIVAHRLSTIEHADKIIFIQDGEKVAEGTKDELLASCPQFKLMWEFHFNPNAQTPITV
ncbi:MAG: ABC transporter ATP-binding protein/permease [Simkaniaceae bacterium]|nr:ABC transporter ATP-binding protein/permease [Simkaniaceae bacterium]